MRKLILCLAGLMLVASMTIGNTPAAHAAVVTVHNNNVTIWLEVIGGDGYRYNIAPRAKANVSSGSSSRRVWVRTNCRLEKDGSPFASAVGRYGYYKNFSWQPTEVDFFHFC